MQLAFDTAEEIEVNGTKIKTVKEWSPYSLAPVAKDTREISLQFPGVNNALTWYQNTVLGYPGLSVQKYLKQPIDILEDTLKELLISKDELLMMHWLYQCVRHKGNPDVQQIWQMPEDFYKSFSQGTAESIQHYEDKIPLWGELKLRPVQAPTPQDMREYPELFEKEWREEYPVYFLKPLVYWLMKQIAISRGFDITTACRMDSLTVDEVYTVYGETQQAYWELIEDSQHSCSRTLVNMTGFIPDGRMYNVALSMIDSSLLF